MFVLQNALTVLLAILVVMLVLQGRRRARPETPSGTDRRRDRETEEDAEAWRRLQAYNAEDAYGIGGRSG